MVERKHRSKSGVGPPRWSASPESPPSNHLPLNPKPQICMVDTCFGPVCRRLPSFTLATAILTAVVLATSVPPVSAFSRTTTSKTWWIRTLSNGLLPPIKIGGQHFQGGTNGRGRRRRKLWFESRRKPLQQQARRAKPSFLLSGRATGHVHRHSRRAAPVRRASRGGIPPLFKTNATIVFPML
jgi:hypothetical protein